MLFADLLRLVAGDTVAVRVPYLLLAFHLARAEQRIRWREIWIPSHGVMLWERFASQLNTCSINSRSQAMSRVFEWAANLGYLQNLS